MQEITIDTPQDSEFGDFFSLLKPRVMSLVVFTAAVGLIAAPVSINPILGITAILFIAIGAGASGALNMWWDRDIDVIMKRTQKRAIPAGRVTASNALHFGIWLSVLSVMMLGLIANPFAAGLLAFTIVFYVVIYTMWLKRWTPQNIVIGGVAGALPPMIGWAVATGGVSTESFLMFLLIFVWTPPHFWALALFMNDDYTKAGVPMLTVTHGDRSTRNHIFVYSWILFSVALAISFSLIGGLFYFLTTIILNAVFMLYAFRVWMNDKEISLSNSWLDERRLFFFSIFYLFGHFTAILVEVLLRYLGWNYALPMLF